MNRSLPLCALSLLLVLFHGQDRALASKSSGWKKPPARAEMVPAVDRYPDARCEQVRASALADLARFCQEEPLDKTRLIDFGHQLELLEQRCHDKKTALQLQKALYEKAHHANKAACTTLAEELSGAKPEKAQAQAPETYF